MQEQGWEDVFASLVAAGIEPDARGAPERLVGGASARVFWRVVLADGTPCVAMWVPAAVGAAEHGAGGSLSEAERWVRMRDTLAGLGVPVPSLIGRARAGAGEWLVVEDLGDVRLFELAQDADLGTLGDLYGRACALLSDFQAQTASLEAPGALGRAAMAAELREFLEMGLEARHGVILRAAERAVVEASFDRLVGALGALPLRFSHRDFQSQNLMATARGLVVIDFQDAFQAPAAYDWVALLRDSYVELPRPLLDALLAAAPSEVRESFDLVTLQRKLKDAGRFITLERRGKPGFVRHYPRTIRYVAEALERTGLFPDLDAVLRTHIPELRA